jgi:hypothetical protein
MDNNTKLVHGLVFNKGSTKTAGGVAEDQQYHGCTFFKGEGVEFGDAVSSFPHHLDFN